MSRVRAIIVGGSNSIHKGGYATHIADFLPKAEIINLAVGDTNSSMGLYRLLAFGKLKRTDIVVWEYAINDRFFAGRLPDEWLLRNVEHTIRHCMRAGCTIVPLILSTQGDYKRANPSPYHARLHYLAYAYGIEVIDAQADLRGKTEQAELDDYKDGAHYRPDGPSVLSIAKRIASFSLSPPRRPKPILPIYCAPGYEPVIDTNLGGGPIRNFANSRLSVDYRDLRDGEVTYSPDIEHGRIISSILLVGLKSGKCIVDISGDRLPMSVEHNYAWITGSILRASLAGSPRTRDIKTVGKSIRFEQTPSSTGDDNYQRGIVAMLIERPA